MFSSEKEIGPDGKQVSWLDQMKRIPAGTEIFKVTYKPKPMSDEWIEMGSITLQTELHTSRFRDERLFYQHIVREDDGPYLPFHWQFPDNKIDPHRQLKYGGRWNMPLPPLDAPRGWPSDDAAAKAMYAEQE